MIGIINGGADAGRIEPNKIKDQPPPIYQDPQLKCFGIGMWNLFGPALRGIGYWVLGFPFSPVFSACSVVKNF
jgi:hypothetical protein